MCANAVTIQVKYRADAFSFKVIASAYVMQTLFFHLWDQCPVSLTKATLNAIRCRRHVTLVTATSTSARRQRAGVAPWVLAPSPCCH